MKLKSLKADRKKGEKRPWTSAEFRCVFIYVKTGRAVLRTAGAEYALRENRLLLLRGPTEYSLEVTQQSFLYYKFSVSAPEAKKAYPNALFAALFFRQLTDGPTLYDLSESAEEAQALASALEREFEARGKRGSERFFTLLRPLILKLHESGPAIFPRVRRNCGAMQRVQTVLENRFKEPIVIKNLPAAAYVTAPYLCSSFKAYSGYSPKQYLTLMRLMHAKRLMLTTTLPVSEVCMESGFSDVNNFIRSFKGFYGSPPKKYKQLNLGLF